jgi:hypothetical protein
MWYHLCLAFYMWRARRHRLNPIWAEFVEGDDLDHRVQSHWEVVTWDVRLGTYVPVTEGRSELEAWQRVDH